MGDPFKLVGLLFVRSAPTVIFVILLLAILDRLFFRPIAQVMKKRAERTVGALARAREEMTEAEAKRRQYEAAVQAARIEIYSQRQAEHQAVLQEHENALRMARERSEALVKEAQVELASEAALVKQQLSISCQSLAREITGKILGTADGGTQA